MQKVEKKRLRNLLRIGSTGSPIFMLTTPQPPHPIRGMGNSAKFVKTTEVVIVVSPWVELELHNAAICSNALTRNPMGIV